MSLNDCYVSLYNFYCFYSSAKLKLGKVCSQLEHEFADVYSLNVDDLKQPSCNTMTSNIVNKAADLDRLMKLMKEKIKNTNFKVKV